MVNKYIDTITIIKTGLETLPDEPKLPVYRAIALSITRAINSQFLIEGDKLPPVRVLADGLFVTPGTITRAYDVLEKDLMIFKRVGDGCYVKKAASQYHYDFSNTSSTQLSDIDLRLNAHIDIGTRIEFSNALRKLSLAETFLQDFCNYSPEMGKFKHRQAGVKWFGFSGVETQVDNVLITSGAQHALFILLATLVKPGGFVAASKVSYPGLVTASRTLNIKLTGLEYDEEGVVPDSLVSALKIHPLQLLYLTPTLDNPTTAIMSDQRREEIAAICQRANIKIISDETLGVISPEQKLNFSAIYPEATFVISSISKVLGPAFRVGFIAAPTSYVQHISAVLKAISWSGDNVATEVACHWILDGTADVHLKKQALEIQKRITLIKPYLDELGAKYNDFCGHFWLDLPEPWRASEFEYEMNKRNILIKTSESFAVGRTEIPQSVRVAICKPSVSQLENALKTLLEVVKNDL